MAEPTTTSTPAEILQRLPGIFDAALKSGEIFFFDSTSSIAPSEFPFEVRLCPALGLKKKPTATYDDDVGPQGPETKRLRTGAAERPSPFRPPYNNATYVGCTEGVDGEPKMSVLLNKFAVLPQHFLLCPVVEEAQSLPPSPGELARVYSFLQAANRERKDMLAFYNGGPGAGASQRWRHVQFVEARAPVTDWVKSMQFERQDRAVIHPTLPYLHIVHPLPASHTVPYPPSEEDLVKLADQLAPALMRVLDLAFDALRRSGGDRSQGWNMLMTLDHLHLIPRSQPSYSLLEGVILDINALGFAGMLLVKSDAEASALTEASAREGGLANLIAKCAVPREFGEQALEAEATQHGGAGAAFDGLEAESAAATDGAQLGAGGSEAMAMAADTGVGKPKM